MVKTGGNAIFFLLKLVERFRQQQLVDGRRKGTGNYIFYEHQHRVVLNSNAFCYSKWILPCDHASYKPVILPVHLSNLLLIMNIFMMCETIYVDIATLPKMCSSIIWTCPAYPLPSCGHHHDKDHRHLGRLQSCTKKIAIQPLSGRLPFTGHHWNLDFGGQNFPIRYVSTFSWNPLP